MGPPRPHSALLSRARATHPKGAVVLWAKHSGAEPTGRKVPFRVDSRLNKKGLGFRVRMGL